MNSPLANHPQLWPMTAETAPELTRVRRCSLYGAVLRAFLVILICLFGLTMAATRGRAAEASEYDVKAAFLAKFPEFVKGGNGGAITVGLLGDDPFGGALDTV